MSYWKTLVGDDSGFSLTEGIMALTVLAIGIVMTITPVISGLDTLADAKVNQVAANLAQAEIERIRSLDYGDVGFPGSNPVGVLTSGETVSIQGLDFDISTTVEYVGSVSGLNIVAGGGDGVAGAYDTGIDYKLVTVIVSHAGMEDVRFDTLVAPPNLGAHEGFSNIVVAFSRIEPVGTPTTEVTDPYPYSCVRLQGALTTTYHTSNAATQTYAGIDPNATNPADPDYYYDVRLGGSCNVVDGFTGWRIHPASLGASEVHVGPTATATAALDLYYPATLIVIAQDELGANLTDADLVVTVGGSSEMYDETSAEFNAATATFTISDFGGYPIVPGYFDLTLDSAGFIQENRPGVAVPSGYPSVLTQTETFNLLGGGATTTTTTLGPTTTGATTTTTTGGTSTVNWDFYVDDWLAWAIHGAKVEFTGGTTGTITAYTDAFGLVSVDLVQGDSMTLTIDSGYGHEVYTAAVIASADNSLAITLNMPAGYGGIKYRDGATVPIDHMGYGPRNSDILDLVPVLLNWEGKATVSVIADGSRWDNSGFCADQTINFNKRKRIDFPGQVKVVDIDRWWNLAGC